MVRQVPISKGRCRVCSTLKEQRKTVENGSNDVDFGVAVVAAVAVVEFSGVRK